MNPKEKAIDLSIKMCSPHDIFKPNLSSNRNALIAVDELINATKLHDLTIYQHGRTYYWEQVKLELEKL